MNRTSLSVALVCGLGAFIGYVTAAQLAYWLHFYPFVAGIVGMIVGGTVGYCTIDFERFCSGVASAYNSTINWKPNMLYWQTLGLSIVTFGMIYAYMLTGLIGSAGILNPSDFKNPLQSFVSMSVLISIWLFVSFSSGFLLTNGNKIKKSHEALLDNKKQALKILLWGNPVGVIVWFVMRLLGIPAYVISNGPSAFQKCLKAARLLGSFAKQAFILVHSDRRLICFVDAALGTAVGWFAFHNAFAGAVAGAILGFVNYEIISIRVLKLAPAK